MSPLRNLASELRADIASPKVVRALAAGFTTGLGLLVVQVAFGSFIFSGPLAPYSPQGVGLVLFGNSAACFVIALAGGFRGAISGLSPALVIVMAQIAATMDAEGDALFVTTAAALMIGAAATGVCFLLIGRYRLANLVRFVPYPVAGGFVAGIGGAVCLAAMSLMGADTDWRAISALVEPSELLKWGPGAAFGIALYLATKRWGRPLILPVSVVLAVGAYHFVLGLLDISGDEARAAGLLLTSTSEGGLWPAVLPTDLAHVNWTAIAIQLPTMLTLVLIALIVVIMNLAGLEMTANQDLDWDREFRATGLASVVAGLGGGTVASVIVPASLRIKRFGAATRLTGVAAALVIAAALFLGDGMLELVPVPLVGGMLFFRRLRHAGRRAGEKPETASLVGVRHHRADCRHHHGLRAVRRCGRRDAGHPRVLRPTLEPCGSDRIALHPRASAEAPRRVPSRIAPFSWKRASVSSPTGCAAISSSEASAL